MAPANRHVAQTPGDCQLSLAGRDTRTQIHSDDPNWRDEHSKHVSPSLKAQRFLFVMANPKVMADTVSITNPAQQTFELFLC